MNFDDLLRRYFGTHALDDLTPAMLAGAQDRMMVDFGLETDRGKRFALWAVMHMLGFAPDIDVAFPSRDDQDAARNFMDLIGGIGRS